MALSSGELSSGELSVNMQVRSVNVGQTDRYTERERETTDKETNR